MNGGIYKGMLNIFVAEIIIAAVVIVTTVLVLVVEHLYFHVSAWGIVLFILFDNC